MSILTITSKEKKSKIYTLKMSALFVVLLWLAFLTFTSNAYAETYEQTYYSDGNDHFMDVQLESGGTHSFFVNHVPLGSYNYVAYKNTGGGYTEIWSDSTSTGWDPKFSTYVNSGYKVKLVIYDGNWNVKSVYYWLIYNDPDPTASRETPASSITIEVETNQGFTVRGKDSGGDLWKVEWSLSGPETHTDQDTLGFSGSNDTVDFTDYSGYTFDVAGNYTLTATVYDESGDTDSVSWSISVVSKSDLTATLRNYEDSDLPVGGTSKFILYTSPMKTEFGSPTTFEDVQPNTYLLEGYFNGNTPFNVFEFWNSEQVTVQQGSTSHKLLRKYPFVYEVEVWDNTSHAKLNPSDEVLPNTTIEFKVIVRSDLVYIPLGAKVNFWIDTNGDGNPDLEMWSSQEQQVPTANGQNQVFSFGFTTTDTGQIRYAPAVYTHLANNAWEWTDSWKWTDAYIVTENAKSITITNTNLGDGAQLDINEMTSITWESTGDIGSYVKIEYSNIDTDDDWHPLLEKGANLGQFNWTPSQNPGDLPTGPYYRIRISSVDDPNIDDESGNFGLYTKDYGVTVITHGWTPRTNRPRWADNLASAIIKRAGKGVAFEYIPNTGKWSFLGNTYSYDGTIWDWDNNHSMPNNIDDGEIVLIFDWAVESAMTAGRGGYGYSEAAGDAMFAALKASLFDYPPTGYSGPDYNHVELFHLMHFIGHSRGNVVNSMAIRRIAEYMPDFTVEQVTLLDPHPVKFVDPGNKIYLWRNQNKSPIGWAVNYWRNGNIDLDFVGEEVDGASNIPLQDDVLSGGGYVLEHSDVHLFYLGTIDITSDASEDDGDGQMLVPDNWYDNMGSIRAHEGFYYSRLGGGGIPDNTTAELSKRAPLSVYDIVPVYNGYFKHNDIFPGRSPGWEFHVGRSTSSAFTHSMLRISCNINTIGADSYAMHNSLYIPEDATTLSFKWDIINKSSYDLFSVLFLPLDNSEGTELYQSPINSVLNSEDVRIPINDLRGKTGILLFSITPDGIKGDSEIGIDNIGILRSGIPIPGLPVQEAQITDNLITTFQWHMESQPNGYTGYQLCVRCDNEVGPASGQELIVYDTGFVAGTAVNHTYNPGAYGGYDSVSECDRTSLPLEYGKTYYWHVRYRDDLGNWSPWSADSSGDHRYFFTVALENNEPVLNNPAVTPTSGDTETDFEFTVNYYDQDGDVPQYVKVYINGSSKTMQLKPGTGTETDSTYSYTTTLPAGSYSYKFKTQDVENGFDEIASTSGLIVEEIPAPSIAKSINSSYMGTNGQDVVFDIWNDGDETLNYSVEVTEGATYFSASPDSGSSTGTSDKNSHTIHVNRDEITPGQTVTGEIRIFLSDADDGPQCIYLSASKAGDVTYILSTSVIGGNGTISAGGTYNSGTDVTLSATPDTNYAVDKWYVNKQIAQTGGNTYTLSNIQSDYDVDVTFKDANPFIIPKLSVTPESRSVGFDSGTTSFSVSNTGSGTMSWTASITFGESWLSIKSGSSGTDSGTITADFTSNDSGSSRTGTIRVTAEGAVGNPKEVTVTQEYKDFPLDTDGDNFSDEDEIKHYSDPNDINDTPNEHKPTTPVIDTSGITNIIENKVISSEVTNLEDEGFKDPDIISRGDYMAGSEWEIELSNSLVYQKAFSFSKEDDYKSLALPAGILQKEKLYIIRTRHQDSTGLWSDWAEASFETVTSDTNDKDGNGIDDECEVKATEYADTNKNGTNDHDEEGLYPIKNAVDRAMVGIETSEGNLNYLSTLSAGDVPIMPGDKMPFGLFSFRIDGLKVDEKDPAKVDVTFHFSELEDTLTGWHKYDYADDKMVDFKSIKINGNRVVLTLTDGGDGDADGVVNGIIIDPSGPVVPGAVPPDPDPGGGGGGGCFISTITN